MALEKRVEWLLDIPPGDAGRRLRDGLIALGATIEDSSELSFVAQTPRLRRPFRFAAKWSVAVTSGTHGSVADLRIETDNDHKPWLDELAEHLSDVIVSRTEPPSNREVIRELMKEREANRAAEKAERRAEKAAAKTARAPSAVAGENDELEVYKVVYRGGLADLPKAKSGEIKLALTPDAFRLSPTLTSNKWWQELRIPYENVLDVEIVGRVVSSFEAILGGINSRQLNQDNNVHITFADALGREVVLRLEMLSGVTVMAQANKCREFEDRLRTLGIRRRFRSSPAAPLETPSGSDIPDKIAQLATLRDQGILTADEFESKKQELLARL